MTPQPQQEFLLSNALQVKRDLIFAFAIAFFMMGVMMEMLGQPMLPNLCFIVGGGFAIVAFLIWVIIVGISKTPIDPTDIKSQLKIIIPMIIVFMIVAGIIAFVHDRQANPTEDFCSEIGENTKPGAMVERAVVLKTGQCIKNETGFHANGKAWFK